MKLKESFHGGMMSTHHRGSIALLLALIATPVAGQDLTGVWRDNTGGRYVIRQAGEEFCWSGENNVFCGLITGPVIAGSWLDLPTGRFRGNGRMVLQIESQNKLVKLRQTANYAASVWTREGSSDARPPTVISFPPPVTQPPSSPTTSQPAAPPAATSNTTRSDTVTWTYREVGNSYKGMNGKMVQFTCPPDQAPMEWRATYGTDVYTDDSALCQAAVHAGVITTRGGTFTIEILPGQLSYIGSRRNGVISVDYANWTGSFRFPSARVSGDVSSAPQTRSVPPVIAAPQPVVVPPPPAAAAVAAEMTAGRGDTPQAFSRQMGTRVRVTCSPGVQYLNRVWGTDVYTLDSEICAAAIHAGLITAADGGKFIVEIRPGENSYRGSTRNGLTSWDYPAFPVSFTFVR